MSRKRYASAPKYSFDGALLCLFWHTVLSPSNRRGCMSSLRASAMADFKDSDFQDSDDRAKSSAGADNGMTLEDLVAVSTVPAQHGRPFPAEPGTLAGAGHGAIDPAATCAQ